MPPPTHTLLVMLGFQSCGADAELRDHDLYHIAGTAVFVRVPQTGCTGPELARLLHTAGGDAVRADLRAAREAYDRLLR